jgi:hypothetical protein
MNAMIANIENELHRPTEMPANVNWFEAMAFSRKG